MMHTVMLPNETLLLMDEDGIGEVRDVCGKLVSRLQLHPMDGWVLDMASSGSDLVVAFNDSVWLYSFTTGRQIRQLLRLTSVLHVHRHPHVVVSSEAGTVLIGEYSNFVMVQLDTGVCIHQDKWNVSREHLHHLGHNQSVAVMMDSTRRQAHVVRLVDGQTVGVYPLAFDVRWKRALRNLTLVDGYMTTEKTQ